ncbi:MAG: ArnT family glycosyltransferase, partial [Pyrinomonadaceae bacterium]
MNLTRRARGLWPVLLILLFYLYGLASFPLIGSDEPRYAQVAREMWMRSDLVTATLGGRLWFEKPALPYWLAMAGYELFGVHEWSARLSSAICGLLATFALYILGRKIDRLSYNTPSANQSPGMFNNSGLIFALVFASSAGAIAFSRGVNFDIAVTMAITLGLVSFFISDIEETKRWRNLWLTGFYASLGLGLLAKGLVGVVLPGAIVLFYFVLRGSWPSKQFLISLLWGGPLTLLVASLWYGPVIYQHGWFFIDQFFIQHHFARYISNKYHHPQPFYFYPPVIALMVFPWTALLIVGLYHCTKWNWRSTAPRDRLRVLAFAWLLFPIAFFTFSVSKLPGYILPALPAAAI